MWKSTLEFAFEMGKNKRLNIDEVSKTMKKELALFDDSFYDDFETPTMEAEAEPPIWQSEEGHYIVENYQPVGTTEFGAPFYQDDDTEIMSAILQTLPKEEQTEMAKSLPSAISWQILSHTEDSPKSNKKQERALSISTLIKHFNIKGKRIHARSQLRNRFEYQSFADQMKIIRLFLAGTPSDREWCYKTLLNWWDDELTADLEQAWIDHKDAPCVKTATRRLSEAFIKQHQEAMGQLDYKNVCRRLAHDDSFVIDKNRLKPTDYCYVIAHNHRHISDQEADNLLFGQIKLILEHSIMYPIYQFKTHFGRDLRERFDDKVRYVPSLLFYRSVGYIIWTLGQTGNAATIIKFHRWNKMLQNNMPKYLEEEMSSAEILDFINRDFQEYQEWNWGIFTKHALSSLLEFYSDDNFEFVPDRLPRFVPYYQHGSDVSDDAFMNLDLIAGLPSFDGTPF